jgi:hypothetical protein
MRGDARHPVRHAADTDDLTNDELPAEAIADVALDVLMLLDGEARGEFLAGFQRLVLEHGGAETAELLRPDPH